MPDKTPNNPGVPAGKKYFYALLAIVALAFAFTLGYSLAGGQPGQLGQTGKNDAAYQQAVSDIKLQLQKAGLITPLGEVRTVSGKVTAVGEDYIEIDAYPLTNNPLEEPTPTKRRVAVSADTKIVMSEPLSAEESDKAMKKFMDDQAKYQAAIAANKEAAPPMPPAMEKITELTLSDLAENDVVSVTAASDIARLASFAATEVRKSSAGTEAAAPAAPGAPGAPAAGAVPGAVMPPTAPPPPPPPPPPPVIPPPTLPAPAMP